MLYGSEMREDWTVLKNDQVNFGRICATTFADDEDVERLLHFFAGGSRFLDLFDLEKREVKLMTRRYRFEHILHHLDIFTPQLHDFLKSMLRVHPDDRLPARELLKHPWLCT
ncbi:hypothetical protein HGRIS_004703 [Hohenbuehelia grisea]|uniref:Protein kinase domain-containing protein n=1 Tax=Hohenbuehelia grisea TaxID=104357 RepID=A0ABR3JDY6_9AGAR